MLLQEYFFMAKKTSQKEGFITLFVNYTSTEDKGKSVFDDDEVLLLESNFVGATINLQAGQGIIKTASTNATSIGSAVFISEGVYFLRGTFVRVDAQTLILDAHGNEPTYKLV